MLLAVVVYFLESNLLAVNIKQLFTFVVKK